MYFEVELPMHVPTALGMLTVSTYNVRLEISLDESIERWGWYVESVQVWGQYGDEPSDWHDLKPEHQIAATCKRLAHSDWHDAIADKWSWHCFNTPRSGRVRTPFRVISSGRD